MSETPRASRARTAVAMMLILIPLVVTAIIKYLPGLTEHQRISSVAILQPRLVVPKEFTYLGNDLSKRLHDALAGLPGLVLQDLPPKDRAPGTANDLAQVAKDAGTDALIVPTLTIDAGIVQLNLLVIETATKKIIFNTPYQSSIDNYPNMMKASTAALRRALQ